MECDNFLQKIHLKNKQRRINEMFEEEGLTDEILNEQLELNRKRHDMDIPDDSEVIYTDEEGNDFVQ